jgi:hypothetical protein
MPSESLLTFVSNSDKTKFGQYMKAQKPIVMSLVMTVLWAPFSSPSSGFPSIADSTLESSHDPHKSYLENLCGNKANII